jgi:hypothetical protein
MLNRNQRACDPEGLPAPKRLRRNVVDLLASGAVSGQRAQELLRDAAAAGSADCGELVRRAGSDKNASRDLRRRLVRQTFWPTDYRCSVRTWDEKRCEVVHREVHMMLPHEALARIWHLGHAGALASTAGLDGVSLQHLAECQAESGPLAAAELGPLLAVGLWGDGCPMNWDRTESLEVLSWNLPGLLGTRWGTLRVPICGLSKKQVVPGDTFDDLLAVVAWSLQQLAVGRFPAARHDGGAWAAEDGRRRLLGGRPLGVRGALTQVRGDWKWFKEVFHFPAWNALAGLCWRCTCTPGQLREVGADAPWRAPAARLDTWGLLARMRANGAVVSPLWAAPWLQSRCFRVDWLHAVDQGVAADFLGSLFLRFLERLGPGTERARCARLWAEIQTWYAARRVQDKLTNLVPTMISKRGASAKLRGSAAQVRALVPFARERAATLLGAEPMDEAAKVAAEQLGRCYDCLSADAPNRGISLEAAARAFALQLVALERASTSPWRWRVKPKVHLFLELAMEGPEGGAAAANWTYRDEDWGGTAARLARRRGGALRPTLVSRNLLLNFKLKTAVPRVVP